MLSNRDIRGEAHARWSATVTSRMERYQTGFALQKGGRETMVAPVHLDFYDVVTHSFEDLLFHITTDAFDALAIPVAPLDPHLRGKMVPRLLSSPADAMDLICDPCMHSKPALSVDAEVWDSNGDCCFKTTDAQKCIPEDAMTLLSAQFNP